MGICVHILIWMKQVQDTEKVFIFLNKNVNWPLLFIFLPYTYLYHNINHIMDEIWIFFGLTRFFNPI